ncbi:MAG TPA: hypothetical protein PK916_13830 [Bacteroidota bacterium]|nr:hypothetical protein [Bacteroidota bacterium]
MRGFSIFAVIATLLATSLTSAQNLERVYPARKHNPLMDVLAWSGDTLVAAGLNGSLLLSTDDGTNWSAVDAGALPLSYFQLGRTANAIYALGYAHDESVATPTSRYGTLPELLRYTPSTGSVDYVPNPAPQFISTADIGTMWEMQASFTEDAVYLLFVHPSKQATLLLSRDDCATWQRVELPATLYHLRGAALYTSTSGRVAITLFNIQVFSKWRILRSMDYGASWHIDMNQSFDLTAPLFPMYWEDENMILLDYNRSAQVSRDNGAQWTAAGWTLPDYPTDWLGALDATVYCCGWGGVLYRSTTGGAQWDTVYTPYQFMGTWAMRLARSARGTLLLVDNTGGIHRSSDEGNTWSTPLKERMLFHEGRMLNDSVGYVRGLDTADPRTRLFRTSDGFRTLEALTTVAELDGGRPIPVTEEFWYTPATSSGAGETIVRISTDGGRQWNTALRAADCEGCRAIPATISTDATTLLPLATGQGLRVSTDGGQTWPSVFSSSWTAPNAPGPIVASARASAIWFVPKALNAWHIVRVSVPNGAIDTVFTLPLAYQRQDVGIRSLTYLDNDVLQAVVVDAKNNLVYHFRGSRNQSEWQAQEVVNLDLKSSEELVSYTALDATKAVTVLLDRIDDHVHRYVWQVRTPADFVPRDIAAGCINPGFQTYSTVFMPADNNGGYFLTGTEIYRLRFGGSTSRNDIARPTDVARIQALWPQPVDARGVLHVRLELPRSEALRLELYDVLGRRTAVLLDGWNAAGFHTVRYPMAGSPTGTYLLRLAGAHSSTSTRVIVHR